MRPPIPHHPFRAMPLCTNDARRLVLSMAAWLSHLACHVDHGPISVLPNSQMHLLLALPKGIPPFCLLWADYKDLWSLSTYRTVHFIPMKFIIDSCSCQFGLRLPRLLLPSFKCSSSAVSVCHQPISDLSWQSLVCLSPVLPSVRLYCGFNRSQLTRWTWEGADGQTKESTNIFTVQIPSVQS